MCEAGSRLKCLDWIIRGVMFGWRVKFGKARAINRRHDGTESQKQEEMDMKNLRKTDPEFMERFEHFAFEEVPNEEGQQLDEETRYMAILATLLGCQGTDAYKVILPKALDAGLSPVQISLLTDRGLLSVSHVAKTFAFRRNLRGSLTR